MNVTKNNVDLVYNALLKHLDATDIGVVDMRGCLGMRDGHYRKLLLYSDRSPFDSIRSGELSNIMINEGIYCINNFFYNIHMLKHAVEAKLAIVRTVLYYLKRDKVFIDILGNGQPFAPQKAKCYEQFAITYELTKS